MRTYQLAAQVGGPTTGAGVALPEIGEDRTVPRAILACLVGGGSGTVRVEASNDNKSWALLATITLSSSTPADGTSCDVRWPYMRAVITAVATGKIDVSVVV